MSFVMSLIGQGNPLDQVTLGAAKPQNLIFFLECVNFHKQIGHNVLEWLLPIWTHVSQEPCELESSFLV